MLLLAGHPHGPCRTNQSLRKSVRGDVLEVEIPSWRLLHPFQLNNLLDFGQSQITVCASNLQLRQRLSQAYFWSSVKETGTECSAPSSFALNPLAIVQLCQFYASHFIPGIANSPSTPAETRKELERTSVLIQMGYISRLMPSERLVISGGDPQSEQ
ncbi:hypothetical protein R1flu_000873 [Riccia fluitans]|uniref:Uncharacterized protein n=1 Tax=Riccia fluitans TaxID=41844 RepID=A0ABD1Y1M8_9MARC